ncbi:hypothetical protein LguiB_028070 [Lonicera macranthoides]
MSLNNNYVSSEEEEEEKVEVEGPGAQLTAVAIDKDKHSPYAVRWAIDHLLLPPNPKLVLIHVRNPDFFLQYQASGVSGTIRNGQGEFNDPEIQKHLGYYRAYCTRKGIILKEIFLDDINISKALLCYINENQITNIVLGAPGRSAKTRKFGEHDVPTIINNTAPDFCSVYIIASGKLQSVRPAARTEITSVAPLSKRPYRSLPPNSRVDQYEPDDGARVQFTRGEQKYIGSERIKTRRKSANFSTENISLLMKRERNSSTRNSLGGDTDFLQQLSSKSLDTTGQNFDFSIEAESQDEEEPSSSPNDVAAEMRRLKLELKQTLSLYNTACKEAISAKQKAKELHQWKIEKENSYEQAKLSQEAALAIAEMEKAKCKAAVEAAEKAQKIADMEAQRRLYAELKAKREAEEKIRALNVLSNNGTSYRKYTIEEIETATNKFSDSLKIGEGGYGPVYRGKLDHTPVAIKVLRPDTTHGKKQFQQEVEVLCCMRHPNMVLLLGACPEYGCLVYEFMNNGSLEDRLFRKGNTPPIPWNLRFKIAAEIAIGLLFLHNTKPEPLVHRDLKPANILLDRNFTSKISDVGLSRLVPASVADSVTQYHITKAAGTFYYIDPEYQQTGKLGTKSDTYSLGILLLQIITARPPMGLTHHVGTAIERGTFSDLLDPAVADWPVEEALSFAKLALNCVELRKKDRPDLGSVVLPELNRLRKFGMRVIE